jgi:hypothetical protein
MKKSNLKLLLAPVKLLSNFENPSSNPLQRPKAAILTLIMLTGIRYRKPPVTS